MTLSHGLSNGLYRGESIRVERLADGIAELCFDRQGEAINKLDARTMRELQAAVDSLRAEAGLRGVLMTSAKDVFIVGADIFEFTALFEKPAAEIAAGSAAESASITALSDLPVPVVAAINGFALGGGLEMALAADYRVAGAAAQLGLPEVTLGIFPGYGGTARLPRLAGLATALDWIVSAKPRSAQASLQAGVVEEVVAPELLRETALRYLQQAIDGSLDWRSRRAQQRGPVAADAEALAAARALAQKTARNFPAALAAVDLLDAATGLSRDDALALESTRFAEIAKTPTARVLVGLFISDQAIRKKGKAYARAARPVKQAAVLGAGIMGGGISYTSALRGVPVVMKDIAQPSLDLGMGEARKLLARQVQTGRLVQDKADAVLASITPTLSYEGFDQANVVVEAVVENLNVKKSVLAEAESKLQPDAVLASNTSSLPIGDLAQALSRPENFVGMHFFNPVPVMALVEVVKGPKSSAQAVATVAAYAATMGKTPIVVQDCPGFLVNRILVGYQVGFVTMIRDGADFAAVDRAMEAFGWPMGPAHLQDVIGTDTSAKVMRIITDAYGPRMSMDFESAIQTMAAAGRYGQKSGSGFYRYERDAAGKSKRCDDPEAQAILAAKQPGGPRPFDPAVIVDRLMLPMVLEAIRCLDEGIADTATEIDTALLLGLAFPRHVGGALRYADTLGAAEVLARCERYEKTLGPLYGPTDSLREYARSGRRFHEG